MGAVNDDQPKPLQNPEWADDEQGYIDPFSDDFDATIPDDPPPRAERRRFSGLVRRHERLADTARDEMLTQADDPNTEAHLGRMMRYHLLFGFHQGLRASETYFSDGDNGRSAEKLNRLAAALGATDFEGMFEQDDAPLN